MLSNCQNNTNTDTNTNINTNTNTNMPWFALFSVFLSARSLYLDLLSL